MAAIVKNVKCVISGAIWPILMKFDRNQTI